MFHNDSPHFTSDHVIRSTETNSPAIFIANVYSFCNRKEGALQRCNRITSAYRAAIAALRRRIGCRPIAEVRGAYWLANSGRPACRMPQT